MDQKFDRAKELLTKINKYDYEYFSNNTSLISDEEYDDIWFELRDLLQDKEVAKALKKHSMPLASEHSHLQKVSHLVPVLSLDKVKIDQNYDKNMKRFIKKYLDNDTSTWLSIQSKLDGLTIVIYKYKDKVLFVTRGGSTKGEDVTQQFTNNQHIMEAVNNLDNGAIVRGEAIISKNNFEQLNFELDNKYSNARNLASSSVRTKDVNTALNYKVDFIAYDIMNAQTLDLYTEDEVLTYLSNCGFDIVTNESHKASDISTLEDIESISNRFRSIDEYEIDGLVVKPHQRTLLPEDDGHHQKGQTAIKFKPQSRQTTLIDVEWNIGNSGRMTPIAIFEEINIGGTQISRASLGSYNVIQKLDLRINDVINVVRSNDVIPQVDSVDTTQRDGSEVAISLPEDSYLDGNITYYKYYEKPLEEKLEQFGNEVEIRSSKRSTFKKIVDAGYLSQISDLYQLRAYKDDLVQIKGLSHKKINDLLDEIDYSRETSFENVLTGLAIPDLGKQSIHKIVQSFGSWNNLKSQADESLDLEGLNYKSIQSLKKLVQQDSQYHQTLEQLKDYIKLEE